MPSSQACLAYSEAGGKVGLVYGPVFKDSYDRGAVLFMAYYRMDEKETVAEPAVVLWVSRTEKTAGALSYRWGEVEENSSSSVALDAKVKWWLDRVGPLSNVIL